MAPETWTNKGELRNFIPQRNDQVKVPGFFLFKDTGVLLKDRYVGVLAFRTILDGKVHFYQN